MAKKYGKRTYSTARRQKKYRIKKYKRYTKYAMKPTTTVAKTPGFSDRTIAKLRYTYYKQITSASGSVFFEIFRGNSVYDPENILGGGQPADFDLWKQFYYQYLVHGCSVKLELMSANAANSAAARVAFVAAPASAPLSLVPEQLGEQPYSRYMLVPNYGGLRRMKLYASTAKIYGRPRITVNSQAGFSAAVSTNPTNQWYFTLAAAAADDGALANLYVKYKFTYYVEFFNRKFSLDTAADNPED